MKVTSPWRRFTLSMFTLNLCLAASLPSLRADEPLTAPVPVSSAEPIPAAPQGESAPAAESISEEPTPARTPEPQTEEPAPQQTAEPEQTAEPMPLQAVELAPPLAAPPSSRLSKVRITDEALTPVDAAPVDAAPADAAPADAAPGKKPADKKQADKDAGIVTELVKERYPNGAVKVEREVAQDREGNFLLHGVYRQFDERGQLICEGQNEQGHHVGVWKRYYANAAQAPLFSTAPYKDFTPPFLSQATYVDGQIDGNWTITDARQRKISEIEFAGGQRHGIAAWYYPNGKLLSQASYDHGRVHGDVMKWGPDASLLGKENYTHGRKFAPKVEYFDAEHKRSEIFYLHAPMVMKTPDNFHTASLAVFEQRGQDEKYGSFRIWHPSGQLARQGEFRYNLPVGKAVWYYANGQLQMEGAYLDGKQEGTWTWWHQNGLKQISGEYKEGVATGQWFWWKEDGKVAQRSDLTAPKIANIPSPTPDAEEGTVRR